MALRELCVWSLCHSDSFGFISWLGGFSPLLTAGFSSLISFVSVILLLVCVLLPINGLCPFL